MQSAKKTAEAIKHAILAYKTLLEKEHGKPVSRNTAARLWMYTEYDAWKLDYQRADDRHSS